jgi:hypothetical protein
MQVYIWRKKTQCVFCECHTCIAFWIPSIQFIFCDFNASIIICTPLIQIFFCDPMWILQMLCLFQWQINTENMGIASFVIMIFLCLWKCCIKSFMENVLIHINATKMFKELPKKCKKRHSFNSKTIIINLVVNLSYHFYQPCCDGACTFGGVLWWDELHLPQSIFYSFKQPKSQLKN